MKNTIYLICIVLIYSCQPSSEYLVKNDRNKIDSIASLKFRNDSLSLIKPIILKTVKINDKTIKITGGPSFVKKLISDRDGNFYKYRNSERNESFIKINITFSSASKAKGHEEDFFPNLNVFSVSESNETKFLGSMDYSLEKEDNLNTYFLESIFDYKETERFVCGLAVNIIKNKRFIISVNKSKDTTFNSKLIIGNKLINNKN